MTILTIIDEIKKQPDCIVLPPQGLPQIEPHHVLPDDLKKFYSVCGGVVLFENSAYTITIVPPQKVVIANPVIIIGVDKETLRNMTKDVSWDWYIIGEGENTQYITINLNTERLGICYDSFWEAHPSNPPIIALSFIQLLENLVSSKGGEWYWHDPNFKKLGYAYEDEWTKNHFQANHNKSNT